MVLCQVCGNDIAPGISLCPFCGGKQDLKPGAGPAASIFHKVVNLERGRPLVESAMRRLRMELKEGHRQRLCVMTLIHGYGSSGKGGAIGVECRKMLEYLREKGEIHTFIPGEEFRMQSGTTRDLLRRFPQLANNANLNKGNRGITLVVL